jgi:hypothetical protein
MSRRNILRLFAGGAALAAGGGWARAGDGRVARLIVQAQKLPAVARRIDFISAVLVGSPYRAYTLIGGPRKPEQFVMRDDCFDCITYCETVLAAALARTPEDYAATLRQIRYRGGDVAWRERNHYFADWCANNTANGICRSVELPGSETIAKTLTEMRALDARRASFTAIPRDSLIANKSELATGDIIGFLSQRRDLDYFHVGFVVVADDGGLWLRHAAKSKGRVLDQPLLRFLGENRVQAVSLLRAREPAGDDGALV